jgi:predicted RNase H-like HicB family nuclease
VEFDVILERNPSTGTWVAEVLGVPGSYTQGANRKEALANIREVLLLLKDTDGLPTNLRVEFAKVRVEA